MQPSIRSVLLLILLSLNSSCGILFGNVKPVSEKSKEVASQNAGDTFGPDWTKLDSEEKSPLDSIPDLAYQKKITASIVSLNSSCRASVKDAPSLEVFAHEPFLGITDITFREQKDSTVDHLPALDTTLQGRLDGLETRMRSIIVRKNECIYDVLFVARPRHFSDDEPVFQKFVSTLRFQ